MDCSLCCNKGCFLLKERVSSNPGPSKVPSLNFLPQLESLSEDLKTLIHKNILADIFVKCKENVIPVHKTILAARSDVFWSKIKNKMIKNGDVVDLSHIDPFILGIFLKYLYTGTISDAITEIHVYKLYIVGMDYAVSGLQKICKCYLGKNMKEYNYIYVVMLADNYNDEELTDAVSAFVIRHVDLMENKEWKTFSGGHPEIAAKILKKL